MRVLHVVPSFYPAWAYGGMPRCAYELCRALVQLGVEVTVWTTDAYDATGRLPDTTAVADGITIRRFPNLSNCLAYHRQFYIPRGLRKYAPLHVGEFDLLHLHSHRHLLQPFVAKPARRARIPYIFTGNGTVPRVERHLSIKGLVDILGARTFLRDAAACIAVAQAEVAHYRAAGVPRERIAVIPNGIRLEEFRTLPARGGFRQRYALGDAPLVLFVGKITPRKGVDVLLRALKRLPVNVQLVVAGNFMMPEQPIRALAQSLCINERVRFVGLLSGSDKLAAFVDADVTAYPSRDEIFGLVPCESLMCGTAVVVCDDSGCGEWTAAAGGGILVRYGDDAALAAALRRLLQAPAERQRHASSGRRYIQEHLGWERVAQQTLALYDSVL